MSGGSGTTTTTKMAGRGRNNPNKTYSDPKCKFFVVFCKIEFGNDSPQLVYLGGVGGWLQCLVSAMSKSVHSASSQCQFTVP